MREALASPDKAKWMNAMEKEMQSLHASNVWDLVELAQDQKAVGSKWVFRFKVNADELVKRHTAGSAGGSRVFTEIIIMELITMKRFPQWSDSNLCEL